MKRRRALRGKPVSAIVQARYGEARQKAYKRAGGRCEVCGVRMSPDAFHAHHRLSRSPLRVDCPCNLLALCHRCHAAIHREPAASRDVGRIIARSDARVPAAVPVRLTHGHVLLDHEGGLTHAAVVSTVSWDMPQSHSGEKAP